MKPYKNLTNRKFGRLLALSPMRDPKKPRYLWECVCDCGAKKVASTTHLLSGAVSSCGCLKVEAGKKMAESNVTHGLSKTRVFRIWAGIHSRCGNPRQTGYENYGGRGIRVCDRWDSFENFHEDMGMPPDAKSQIDRIDVNGNYELSNCRWISPKENSRNKRSNRVIEHGGISMCLTEWALRLGITHQALHRRIDVLGWDLDKAMTMGKTR